MHTLSRMFTPALLAAGLGFGAMVPAPAQAQDNLSRVLVDIADVVFRSGDPYYRQGHYGYNDRLVMGRDRYGRQVYYRVVPRYDNYNRHDVRYGAPYAYDYDRNVRNVKCNKHGKCKVEYYDPGHDRRGYDDDRYDDRRHGRYDDD